VPGPGGGELLGDASGCGTAHGQQEATLGAEALDERRGNHASFLGNVSESELRRAAALHDAHGGGEDFFVGSLARPRRHFSRLGYLAEGTPPQQLKNN